MFMRGATTLAGLTLALSGIAVVSAQEAPQETVPPQDSAIMESGSLTVIKQAVGGSATFGFTGNNGIEPFEISVLDGEESYVMSKLIAGQTYTITENTLPTNWSQTSNTCTDVMVVADTNVNCTIVNTYIEPAPTTYSISGKVYNDNNTENGQLDEGEQGLEGWTVYIDEPVGEGDGNNEFDGEELSDISDENGNYTISGLLPGCYTVREELQNNWNQTEPTEVDDFEYVVSVGGRICGGDYTFIDSLKNLFIKTANAAVAYPLEVSGKNFGNVEQSRGGSSGSRPKKDDSSSTTDQGPVLGDSTNIPLVQPLVLGATLPVTGNPTWVLLMIVLFAAPMLYFRKLAVKNN